MLIAKIELGMKDRKKSTRNETYEGREKEGVTRR
jgi:hypothetical protein